MKRLILNIALLVTILLITVVLMFSEYLNNQEREITVVDKYIKRNGKADMYLVVDENKNTYKITDLFFKFKFNSTDLYNELEVGQTYNIKTSGFRIKILSQYPNVNKIEKSEDQLIRVKVRIFFKEVETEIELPDYLDKEEIEQELNEQICIREEELLEKTEIDYFEEI